MIAFIVTAGLGLVLMVALYLLLWRPSDSVVAQLRAHLHKVLPRPRKAESRKQKAQREPVMVPLALAPSAEVMRRREAVLRLAEERASIPPLLELSESIHEDDSDSSALRARGSELGGAAGDAQRASRDMYALHLPNPAKIYGLLEGYEYNELENRNSYEPSYVLDLGEEEAELIRENDFRANENRNNDNENNDDLIRDVLLQSRSNVGDFIPLHLGDWNERFQRAMEKLEALKNDSNVSIEERIRVGRDLINLSQDFNHLSTMYGRVIISEAFLPDNQKTIHATKLGGMAGGEKYIVGNIVYKFALDNNNVLGSDYAAAKVAGHELKGLLSVFNANITGLAVPLMALVDYCGFRLIAMSILPISRQTIVYGSNDYGQTVHSSAAPQRVASLKRLAQHLNLKPHYCGTPKSKPVKVYTPCDLEGHESHDHRFYLLDYSRMMPPETPRPGGVRTAHLFRLLRPEFVRSYVNPLCSDGYSSFIRHHNALPLNKEIARATAVLQSELIPQFAPEFTSSLVAEVEAHGWRAMETFRSSEALHRRGINIRYLGLLRKHTHNSDVRTFLLIEIFARVAKNLLRYLLREKMKSLRLPLEEPYRKLIIDYLNLLFGDSDRSDVYWNTVIRKNVQAHFHDALSAEECQEEFFLKPTLTYFSGESTDGKYLLLMRIAAMSGLQLSAALLNDLQERPNAWAPRGNEPFDDVDLVSINARTKHMGIINQTIGWNYLMRATAKYGTDLAAAERLLKLALARFQEALDTDVRNPDVLCNIGIVSMRLLELQGDLKTLDESDIQVVQIQSYFLRAESESTSMDGRIRSKVAVSYGNFLETSNRFREAEEYYLRALEADPSNDQALLDYGNMLQSRGEFAFAEQLFSRMTNRMNE